MTDSFNTILVVDDHIEVVRGLIEDLVEEGFRVYSGHQGQLPIMAKAHRADLIIVEETALHLEESASLKTLSQIFETRETPVILLGDEKGFNSDFRQEQGRWIGRLAKPIDLERLHAMLRQVLPSYRAIQTLPGTPFQLPAK